MKLTSAEAAKLLRKLNEEYVDLLTRDIYPSLNFWDVKKELIKIKNILECVLICEYPR